MGVDVGESGTGARVGTDGTTDFETFARRCGPDLRRVLVARYGVDVGIEAAADALAYAWERWARVAPMENPMGYLVRVGQSAARRYRHRPVVMPDRQSQTESSFDPRLPRALERLSPRQRTGVVLICVHDWTYPAAAAVLGVSESTLRNHVRRGLESLRRELGEGSE
jgi:DNA-directed RNA polymerase specialized sigma24 family protein